MTLYSSVNQGIYGHWLGGGGPKYIPRLRVIEKYSALYSSVRHNQGIYLYIFLVPMNIEPYIDQSYSP
jgi:hypothetical protein